MQGTFVLDLHDLDTAGKSFSAEIPVDWLKTALEDTEAEPSEGPGSIEVRYSRTGTDVIVHGRVKAELRLPCVRCLEPVSAPIDAELSLLLVSSAKAEVGRGPEKSKGKSRPDDSDLPNDLLDVETYSGDKVILDPYVRDALLLEAPPFPLCSEECPGIAPPPSNEGVGDDSIDPRLAPLRSFSSRLKPPTLATPVF